MKPLIFLMSTFLSIPTLAAPPVPVIPLNQYLAVVDYAKEGKQTGCGLRATGETENDLWINVLLSVFTRESGEMFGMFKVVIKKIEMQNGKPVIQNGRITYSSIGKIRKAWIKTGSGVQPMIYKEGESSHSDGYMASLEFKNAIDLLIAISQVDFRVGYSQNEAGSEEVLEFNKRITRDEARKLSACMNNLRGTRAERSDKSF